MFPKRTGEKATLNARFPRFPGLTAEKRGQTGFPDSRYPVTNTESLYALKKLFVFQADFVDQLGVDDDALL